MVANDKLQLLRAIAMHCVSKREMVFPVFQKPDGKTLQD